MNEGAQDEADIPVLTQVIEDLPPKPLHGAALEALAKDIERAVIARLGPEIERVVRDAVAASLAQALGEPRRD
jgi:hypothetical protein